MTILRSRNLIYTYRDKAIIKYCWMKITYHNFNGTFGDLGRDVQGLEKGGLLGTHTCVLGLNIDITRCNCTCSGRSCYLNLINIKYRCKKVLYTVTTIAAVFPRIKRCKQVLEPYSSFFPAVFGKNISSCSKLSHNSK